MTRRTLLKAAASLLACVIAPFQMVAGTFCNPESAAKAPRRRPTWFVAIVESSRPADDGFGFVYTLREVVSIGDYRWDESGERIEARDWPTAMTSECGTFRWVPLKPETKVNVVHTEDGVFLSPAWLLE